MQAVYYKWTPCYSINGHLAQPQQHHCPYKLAFKWACWQQICRHIEQFKQELEAMTSDSLSAPDLD